MENPSEIQGQENTSSDDPTCPLNRKHIHELILCDKDATKDFDALNTTKELCMVLNK